MNVLVAIAASRLDRPVQDRSLFRAGKVALLTRDFQVFSRQRVSSLLMVQLHLFPARNIVAAAAIVLELALMGVCLMTIPTRGKRNLFQFSRFVTLLALETDVFPSKRIFGLVMVIRPGFPGHFRVTLRTGCPQRRTVRIAVTTVAAGEGNARPLFLRVAFLARYVLVDSLQWKSRQPVIVL
jgi:hypothetical protein